jgi:hypothetical protein
MEWDAWSISGGKRERLWYEEREIRKHGLKKKVKKEKGEKEEYCHRRASRAIFEMTGR